MTVVEKPDDLNKQKEYTKKELNNCALNFASYLYQLWIKSDKGEIIKEDKIDYDNKEPASNN